MIARFYQGTNLSQNRFKTACFLFPLLLMLTGCQAFGLGEPEKKVACPDYLILKNAAEITSGEDQNPAWKIGIDRLAAECMARGDQMAMRVGAKFLATRQSSEIAIPADARYFIAIIDKDDNVIGKQFDALSFEFKDETPTNAEVIGQNEIKFPVSSENYKIYVGLDRPVQNPTKAENQ